MTTMTNAPSSPAAVQDGAVLWQHRTLCGFALPLRAPREGVWSREVDGASVAMGAEGTAAAAPDRALRLPAGRAVRLLLLHVATAALRANATAVEIGPDAAAVARSLGLEPTPARLKDLEEQMARLIAARLRVTDGHGTALSVLDARRLGRGTDPSAWRPVLHLSARFLASLQRNAVALDRRVAAALADSAPALDAYAWLVANSPGVGVEPGVEENRPVLVPWPSLQARFGQDGASPARFSAAFAESLEAARAAWPEARFTVGADGVELGIPGPAPDHGTTVEAGTDGIEPPPEASPLNTAAPDEDPPDARLEPIQPPPALPEAHAAPEPAHERVEPAIPAARLAVPDRVDLVPAHAEDRPDRERRQPPPEREGGRVRLAPKLTGLDLSVWLRRGGEGEGVILEVTPGADYHSTRRSLLILEPVILQVAGHLLPRELEQVAAWAVVNAEVIEDYWDGTLASVFDLARRVKPVAAIARW